MDLILDRRRSTRQSAPGLKRDVFFSSAAARLRSARRMRRFYSLRSVITRRERASFGSCCSASPLALSVCKFQRGRDGEREWSLQFKSATANTHTCTMCISERGESNGIESATANTHPHDVHTWARRDWERALVSQQVRLKMQQRTHTRTMCTPEREEIGRESKRCHKEIENATANTYTPLCIICKVRGR